MSEHKLPQKIRERLGLVGIRSVPRDAGAEVRRRANRVRKYAGYRLKRWEDHALPGDSSEYGKLNAPDPEEARIAVRLAKVDAARNKSKEAA